MQNIEISKKALKFLNSGKNERKHSTEVEKHQKSHKQSNRKNTDAFKRFGQEKAQQNALSFVGNLFEQPEEKPLNLFVNATRAERDAAEIRFIEQKKEEEKKSTVSITNKQYLTNLITGKEVMHNTQFEAQKRQKELSRKLPGIPFYPKTALPVFLPPGDYTVSFRYGVNAPRYVPTDDEGGFELVDGVEMRNVSKTYTLNQMTNFRDMIQAKEDDILEHYENSWRPAHIAHTDISLIKVRPLTTAQIPLRENQHLSYQYFKELNDKINKNRDMCVIDYLLYELGGVVGYKNYNRLHYEKMLGSSTPTLEQIVKFVKRKDDLSLHVFDPFFRRVKMVDGTTAKIIADKPVACLTFLINDSHIFAIPKDMRNSLVQKNKLTFKDLVSEHDINEFNYEFFDIQFDHSLDHWDQEDKYLWDFCVEKIKKIQFSTKKYILIDGFNFRQLVKIITEQTGLNVPNIDFDKRGNIMWFIHPITNAVVIDSREYGQRCNLLENLKQKTQYVKFAFANQNYAVIGKDLLEYTLRHPLTKFESFYSPDYLHDIQEYPVRQLIRNCGGSIDHYDTRYTTSFDIRRAYTAILQKNEYNYNVFSSLDHKQKYTGGAIVEGEYFVKRDFKIFKNTFPMLEGLYPHNFITFCLERKYITKDDITYYYAARKFAKNDTFKPFVDFVLNEENQINGDNQKKLVNFAIGQLGKLSTKKYEGFITKSQDQAIAAHFDYGAEYETLDELHFVKRQIETLKYSGYLPIHRMIISGCYILMDEMYDVAMQKNSKLLCVNTDSLKIFNPAPYQFEETGAPGTYKNEGQVKRIIGFSFDELKEKRDPEKFKRFKITEQEKDIEDSDEGILVDAPPGFGKSYLLSAIHKNISQTNQLLEDNGNDEYIRKMIVLNPTNKSRIVLMNDYGIPAATIDSFLSSENVCDENGDIKMLPINKIIDKFADIQIVILDEYSMIKTEFWDIFVQIKLKHGTTFMIFGDIEQCAAINEYDILYNYKANKTIHWLVDYNKKTLKYRKNAARYTKRYYEEVIKYLQEHRELPDCLKESICDDSNDLFEPCDDLRYICFTLKQVEKYNKIMMDYHKIKTFAIGMPIICTANLKKNNQQENDFEAYNGLIFTIVNETQTCFMIKNEKTKEMKIEKTLVKQFFEPAYAITIYKSQGSTFEGKVNVIGMNSRNISYNDVLVAVSRVRDLQYIRTDAKAQNRVYEYRTSEQRICINDHLIEKAKKQKRYCVDFGGIEIKKGYIYKYEDENENHIYIGQTNDIDRRNDEHLFHKTDPEALVNWFETKRPSLEILDQVYYISKRDLLNYEKTHINNPLYKGRLLNGQNIIKLEKSINETFISENEEKVETKTNNEALTQANEKKAKVEKISKQDKIKIVDNEKESRFYLRVFSEGKYLINLKPRYNSKNKTKIYAELEVALVQFKAEYY